MTKCPIDGSRMWSKDDLHYGCHHGHVMAKDAVIAAAESPERPLTVVQPRMHWPWWRHAEIPWALLALALLAQIVEVVL